MTTPQQPELPALLPCPFCGAAPFENHIEAHVHVFVPMPPSNGEYVIECACGAGLIDPNRERVIERWNTRAQAAVLADRERRWTFVVDALPPVNTEVLVAFEGLDLPSTGQYTGSDHDVSGWCYPCENCGTVGDFEDPIVIAWMPLPAAPSKVEDKKP